jgi:CheY-like chemotaxis protein
MLPETNQERKAVWDAGNRHSGQPRINEAFPRELRETDMAIRFPDLPVMMVTAYGDDERRRRASDLGASEFLAKPVDFDALKVQLRQLSAAP